MPDDEALFLDALYLGVRDVTSLRALNLLCRLFDVQSATLLDFDAARPEVSHHASVGVLSGEILRRYERDFNPRDLTAGRLHRRLAYRLPCRLEADAFGAEAELGHLPGHD